MTETFSTDAGDSPGGRSSKIASFLNVAIPLFEKGGPILTLFMAIAAGIVIWWLLQLITLQQLNTRSMFDIIVQHCNNEAQRLYDLMKAQP